MESTLHPAISFVVDHPPTGENNVKGNSSSVVLGDMSVTFFSDKYVSLYPTVPGPNQNSQIPNFLLAKSLPSNEFLILFCSMPRLSKHGLSVVAACYKAAHTIVDSRQVLMIVSFLRTLKAESLILFSELPHFSNLLNCNKEAMIV